MKTLRTFLTDQQVLLKDTSSSQLNLDSLKKTIGESRSKNAKNSHWIRQERIEKGRDYVQNHFKVLVNETGRGGRYLVERDNFSYQENPDF